MMPDTASASRRAPASFRVGRCARLRARLRRAGILLAAGMAMTACAARPGPEVLNPTDVSVPGAKAVTIYVATTRGSEVAGGNRFAARRAPATSYDAFRISIPPTHRPGQIEWPRGKPDPARNFVTLQQEELGERTFLKEVATREAARAKHKVWVFVHGYNSSFQESLFRFAQLIADADADSVPILFAWPSEGELRGYVADKDAATYSRDALARLLVQLAQDRTAQITVVGHSMGGWLTVEALRQLRLSGRDAVLARLEVVLAAPDIDLDVFRAQTDVIGPLSPPMTVLVSRDDVALSVSRRIAGERPRVGSLDVNDPRVQELAMRTHVQIVDISTLRATDGFNHDRFVGLAALYPKFANTPQAQPGYPLRQAGAFVFDAVGTTLSAPFSLAGRALSGQ